MGIRFPINLAFDAVRIDELFLKHLFCRSYQLVRSLWHGVIGGMSPA